MDHADILSRGLRDMGFTEEHIKRRMSELLAAGREAKEQEALHGSIRAPESELQARAAMALGGLDRRLQGSPMSLMSPTATQSRYGKEAYGEEPSPAEKLFSVLELSDVIPSPLMAMPAITKGGRRMIEAFHGSPHKFDRFSMENIGTGEGAQAYGHGLYFADSEDVARSYRDDLNSLYSKQHSLDGEPVPAWIVAEADAGRIDKIREDFAGRVAEANAKLSDPNTVQPWIVEQQKATAEKTLRQIDALTGGKSADPPGALYRVHIDADPDTLLDWDKPLSEQSEAIQQAVKGSLVSRRLEDMSDDEFYSVMQNIDPNGVWSPEDQINEFGEVLSKDELIANLKEYSPDTYNETVAYLSADFDPSMSGASLYRQATAQRGGGQVMSNDAQRRLSEDLRKEGIPGIRYLDGNSRGAGEGSYNYVMFDDAPISIQGLLD